MPYHRRYLHTSSWSLLLRPIPTRYEWAKIRHQPKTRAGAWHVPRSRKRRNQKKCAITRSGSQIHHAQILKAQRTNKMLRLPGIFARPPAASHLVPWPSDVNYIEESEVAYYITFPDIGYRDPCECVGDCFPDTCRNALLSIYCTPDCCSLEANCMNAPRTLSTINHFDTGRVGYGVYTTTYLEWATSWPSMLGVCANTQLWWKNNPR
ncbi:LOW QUALITY PROTEIN: Set domain-containing hypothetical protein [Phytophthora megakarya]|uniref:Uncharacterized protein n=1 Tax=Phytophthora megakarya TaxID=4795 RepID=A0A225UVX1_9STRA|nr:LOW QUALITY PROTEIN: Set domain-containing hypothetical protein [Phytophthora megakarya]